MKEDVLQRSMRYMVEILNKQYVEPWTRALRSRAEEAAPMIRDGARFMAMIDNNINHLRGAGMTYDATARLINKVASVAYATRFIMPGYLIRNLLQATVLHHQRREFLRLVLKDKAIPEETKNWFNTYCLQNTAIKIHLLMSQVPIVTDKGRMRFIKLPFRGIERLRDWANGTALAALTDEVTRAQTFYTQWMTVHHAAKKFLPEDVSLATRRDLERFIETAGIYKLSSAQQKAAMFDLKTGGVEAVARRVAKEYTADENFLYDIAQRPFSHQTQLGRAVWNLSTYPRSYMQLLVRRVEMLGTHSGTSLKQKVKIASDIAGVLAVGWATNKVWQNATGSRGAAYDPLDTIAWQPGGLMLGVPSEIGQLSRSTILALQGDQQQLGKVLNQIASLTNLALPFYEPLIHAIETGTNTKNIDKLALRKIREALSERYKVRGSDYDVDRDRVWMVRHFIMGTDPPTKKQGGSRRGTLGKLGKQE